MCENDINKVLKKIRQTESMIRNTRDSIEQRKGDIEKNKFLIEKYNNDIPELYNKVDRELDFIERYSNVIKGYDITTVPAITNSMKKIEEIKRRINEYERHREKLLKDIENSYKYIKAEEVFIERWTEELKELKETRDLLESNKPYDEESGRDCCCADKKTSLLDRVVKIAIPLLIIIRILI